MPLSSVVRRVGARMEWVTGRLKNQSPLENQQSTPLQPARARDNRIDTVRGIACILLVAYHVVGLGPETGMRLPQGHWLLAVNHSLGDIRMPLFTFLSGLVYAAHPVGYRRILTFLKGKVLRLLIPLVVVGFSFAAVQRFTPGANQLLSLEEMPLIPFYPYAHFWFLQALFLIFMLMIPLERGKLLKTLPAALAVQVASMLLFLLRDLLPDFFSVKRAFYLFPFFLAGLVIARFPSKVGRVGMPALILVGIPSAALAIAYLSGWWIGVGGFAELTIGTGFAVALVTYVRAIPMLAAIGFYSYTIYLFHVFGTAGARIFLERLEAGPALIFFVALVAGISLPIAIHLLLHRVPYLSRAFLGIKPLPPRNRLTLSPEPS